MKKILFLHGFYASGQCVPALALRESFERRAEVLTPDLPMHPKEAIQFIRELIDREKPDLLVGNSCGAFYAQMLAPIVGIPALLGNPHFQMTEFLKQRIGEHQYKSPRKDGKQDFTINEALIEEFAELEAIQFNHCNPYYKDRIWGLFGEQDTLAHFEPLFLEHYNQSFHFPGGHTPTAEEVRDWYVPLAEKLLMNLETDRLRLRPWLDSDAGELYKYAKDPQVGPVAGWPAHQSVEESLQIIRTVFSVPETYAIVPKDTELPIGCIGLKIGEATDLTERDDECELGYWLGVPYWGHGLMTEAAKEIIRHAFEECGMMKVWASYYDGNNRSKRVQEKCGFIHQWTTDNVDVPLMNETRKVHVGCLTKEEWIANSTRSDINKQSPEGCCRFQRRSGQGNGILTL